MKRQLDMSHIIEPDSMRPAPRHNDAHPAVVTADTARQGPRGTRVLYVLLAAIGLICVLFAAIYVVYMNNWQGIAQ
jgi:hypothetical protein